jgi:hypothetical protein
MASAVSKLDQQRANLRHYASDIFMPLRSARGEFYSFQKTRTAVPRSQGRPTRYWPR